jgi:hypothetical protein
VALSSSPGRPGASPDSPVWTAEARGGAEKAVGVIDLAVKAIMLVYTLAAAWQVAKALNPPLQVRQDIAVAALRARFARPPLERLPELPAGAARPIYDDTR